MGDFGLKVTLPGNDISTAADSQLLFNSSWPNLKIAFSDVIQIPPVGQLSQNGYILYNHNLGIVPLVLPFQGFPNTAELGNLTSAINNDFIQVDGTNVYYISFTPPTSVGLVIYYLDITQPFTAPIIQTGTSTTSSPDPDWGFKLTKDGYDAGSTDLRDFLIHTSARSPMVHAVVPGTFNAAGTFSYTHDLPYNPIFFVFIQQLGETAYFLASLGSEATTAVNNTITVGGSPGAGVSIVILQDPFIITDNILTVAV